MKPILFNTPMTQATKEDRKKETRRDPFQVPGGYEYKGLYWVEQPKGTRLCAVLHHADGTDINIPARYQPGDILWVRETWAHPSTAEIAAGADPDMYLYKADSMQPAAWDKWRPSIHMPKEAARLFLRVTGVRVERLRDMCLADVLMEGIREADSYEGTWDRWHDTWNSTIKPAPLSLYGWEANPWVWVIEFERISKAAALGGGGDGS